MKELIERAVSGDKKALEELLLSVQDMVYNLSLRMLGTIRDTEDATQEIMIKIMTHLSTFKMESAFKTWVYRISVNHLLNYKKSMFAQRPLSFEFYGEDIQNGFIDIENSTLNNIDENILAEELKMSCTNVMLQCLDRESRCIYVLGTMFKVDSKIAGEILDISPEAYRQKLSRIRNKVTDFLSTYCGLSNGMCNCKKRIGYAVTNHRLDPTNLEYSAQTKLEDNYLLDYTQSMENIDKLSDVFKSLPHYRSPEAAKAFLQKLIQSADMHRIQAESK